MELEKKIVYYILKHQNDIHPFRLSRILLLFEMEYARKYGEKPTNFVYRLQPYTFFIENFTKFIEETPLIEKVKITDDKGIPIKGFLRLTSQEVDDSLPVEMREILDRIIEETSKLDDQELNRLIVDSSDYKKLYELYGD